MAHIRLDYRSKCTAHVHIATAYIYICSSYQTLTVQPRVVHDQPWPNITTSPNHKKVHMHTHKTIPARPNDQWFYIYIIYILML